MTNELPPRSTSTTRPRLLSVIGAAVAVLAVGSLLIWHSQVGDLFAGD
jgi:D-alanyl-D-alanine carboxypeptidase